MTRSCAPRAKLVPLGRRDGTAVQIGLGLFAAAVLDRPPTRLALFWRAAVYIPVVTSFVVVSWVFSYIFASQGGIANAFSGFSPATPKASTGRRVPGRPTGSCGS
jgi:hypothetical protein